MLPDRRTRTAYSSSSSSSSSSSLDLAKGSPVSTVSLGRRTTRATSVGLLPPPTAAEIVADYQAMYAQAVSLVRPARGF